MCIRDSYERALAIFRALEPDVGKQFSVQEQAQYCYLPIYDPGLVFFGSGGVFGGPVVTFSAGFPIGVWLNYDLSLIHI